MTDREKIIKIAQPYVSAWGDDERLADALIAANIGDVTEWKLRAEVTERALATVCEEVLHARYPVESVTASVVDDFIQYTLKEAEKELAEEVKDD